MTDDQGYGDLGFTGNPLVQTPHIDQLAEEGVQFTDFHVDPTCSPTRAALMTGQNSLRAGVWHTIMGRSLLPTEKVTIAERLQDAGYRTGIFGKWHLGDNYPFRPDDQGFSSTVIHGGGGVGQTPDAWGNTQFDDTYFVNGEPQRFAGNSTDVWFDEAEAFLAQSAEAGDPAFAYVALNAPHRPWRAPDAYIDRYTDKGFPLPLTKFYAMITHLDERVGRIKTLTDNLGDGRETVLIFLTDNGSAFNLNNDTYMQGPWQDGLERLQEEAGERWQPNAGMRGLKASVYDGGHRVPLVIAGAEMGGGRVVDQLTAHYDLYPTILDLAGIEADDLDIDGQSLVPLLDGQPGDSERTIVVTNQRVFDPRPGRPTAVLTKRWRLVSHRDDGREELFDIVADPGQAEDIAVQHPEVVAQLRREIDDWWDKASAGGFPTQRISVGADDAPSVRLTAMDWMEAPSTDAVPWFPGFQPPREEIAYVSWLGRESAFEPLPWYLSVVSDGSFVIRATVHAREASTPIGHERAVLQIDGGERREVPVFGLASSAEWRVSLDRGDRTLRVWFESGTTDRIRRTPAFYVSIDGPKAQ